MSEEDRRLIEEMKDNCIKQANYVDVKAMNKYNALRNLQQENQQLKQKYEMQKDSNKLLCKAITCDDCDCKVCEAHIQNIKYKSVLDEIRKYINERTDRRSSCRSLVYGDEILQILDKVKE